MATKNSIWPNWSSNKLFTALSALVLIIVIAWIAVLIRSEFKEYDYIGQSPEFRNEITLTGQGRVVAIPDIATVNIGIRTEKENVEAAQAENTEKMNQLVEELKDLEIADKDLKTVNYSINPVYDWTEDQGRVLKGYEVNQSLQVKIRNLDLIGDVLATATEQGANQVGGINFTIDDEEVYKKQAREEALKNAKQKAESLAAIAGVKLGKITSFNEVTSGPISPIDREAVYQKTEAVGLGGAAPSPDIEAGSMEITVTAAISYEIL